MVFYEKIKIVALGEIEIFFNYKVGILLTNSIDIKIVKYGAKFLIFNFRSMFESSKIKGIKISNPPAGAGTPSKKLFFHNSLFSILVKLNLANLKTQHTEYNKVTAQPSFP